MGIWNPPLVEAVQRQPFFEICWYHYWILKPLQVKNALKSFAKLHLNIGLFIFCKKVFFDAELHGFFTSKCFLSRNVFHFFSRFSHVTWSRTAKQNRKTKTQMKNEIIIRRRLKNTFLSLSLFSILHLSAFASHRTS